jgi:hypothetical protein
LCVNFVVLDEGHVVKSLSFCCYICVFSLYYCYVHRFLGEGCAWNFVVLDEGHVVKNPKSKTTIAVKQVALNARVWMWVGGWVGG